jgi:hypothetical protein
METTLTSTKLAFKRTSVGVAASTVAAIGVLLSQTKLPAASIDVTSSETAVVLKDKAAALKLPPAPLDTTKLLTGAALIAAASAIRSPRAKAGFFGSLAHLPWTTISLIGASQLWKSGVSLPAGMGAVIGAFVVGSVVKTISTDE